MTKVYIVMGEFHILEVFFKKRKAEEMADRLKAKGELWIEVLEWEVQE